MSFEETLEKYIRALVADTIDNMEEVGALHARLVEVERSLQSEMPHTIRAELDNLRKECAAAMPTYLELRVARLEAAMDQRTTRSQTKDIAYETVRDADMDVLFGSYVEDKIADVLDDDEFRDRLHYIIDEKLERVEISLKVK